MTDAKNIINHIGMVLDASSSMAGHTGDLVRVVDGQVTHLAQRSKELDQETRVSVWMFSDANDIHCIVWDMDVLRLPSIAKFYNTSGSTALIDATLASIRDLKEIPERYGDHSFLLYAFSDGQENDSRRSPEDIKKTITELPDRWTVAALVPNQTAKHEAKRFGFPAGNIEVWDTTSKHGVSEVGERIRAATDSYMTARTTGIRSTQNLFSTSPQNLNAKTVQQAKLTPLKPSDYILTPVPRDATIKDFTEACGYKYVVGHGFYQLMKTETIQPQKEIAIVERGGGENVYIGPDARQILGLSNVAVRVKPAYNPDYVVFVQSTSINRKLIAGTRFLYRV